MDTIKNFPTHREVKKKQRKKIKEDFFFVPSWPNHNQPTFFTFHTNLHHHKTPLSAKASSEHDNFNHFKPHHVKTLHLQQNWKVRFHFHHRTTQLRDLDAFHRNRDSIFTTNKLDSAVDLTSIKCTACGCRRNFRRRSLQTHPQAVALDPPLKDLRLAKPSCIFLLHQITSHELPPIYTQEE